MFQVGLTAEWGAGCAERPKLMLRNGGRPFPAELKYISLRIFGILGAKFRKDFM